MMKNYQIIDAEAVEITSAGAGRGVKSVRTVLVRPAAAIGAVVGAAQLWATDPVTGQHHVTGSTMVGGAESESP